MTDVSMSPVVVRHEGATCGGGGRAAPGVAGWLGLAAAPTLAIMALWSAFFSGQPDMLCMAMQGSSPMSGMTLMYLLMSAFHSSPWLKLISSRRNGARRHVRAAFGNPVPLQAIYERWIAKFEKPRLKALGDLKRRLEKLGVSSQNLEIQNKKPNAQKM